MVTGKMTKKRDVMPSFDFDAISFKLKVCTLVPIHRSAVSVKNQRVFVGRRRNVG